MAIDWLAKLGRKGFEALLTSIVGKSVDKALRDRIEPRLAGIESELRGVRDRMAAVETRLAAVEPGWM